MAAISLPSVTRSSLTLPVILRPPNRDELLRLLAANYERAKKIADVDVRSLHQLVEHSPEDMTASVEAGITLADFQRILFATGQWLPIDPPSAETLTIADLLAFDLSGSRRLGYGTIRDYLIGIKVALADGTLIKAGGKVVKNVAGYDLCKLFIGARHTLGIIVETTFKLRPLPEAEAVVHREVSSFAELERLRTALLNSLAQPTLFDASTDKGKIFLSAAFSGNSEDVAAQLSIAEALEFSLRLAPNVASAFDTRNAQKTSVIPSRTVAALQELGCEQWIAHLGNGVIYHTGQTLTADLRPTSVLMDRVKSAYDPKAILPTYSA